MRRFIYFILIVSTSVSFAQIHEVGLFLGGSSFIGDIGNTNYIAPNHIAGGLVYKYNLNPRIAIRGNYTALPLQGDDRQSDNLVRNQRNFKFNNTAHELAVGLEFNFFEYNVRSLGHTFTPYILLQVAAYNYKTPESIVGNNIQFTSDISYSIPVGIGFKGRITDHWAFAFEAAVRFNFVDNIDYTTNKISSLNFGGNGNDFYTFTGLSLVYTFGRPACYADND